MELLSCSAARSIGAVVRGVSLSGRSSSGGHTPLQEAAGKLRAALLRSKLLVFHPECAAGRSGSGALTEDELVDFFSVFDTPLPQEGRENSRGQRKEIFKVTNLHDVPAGEEAPTSPFLTDAELEFHSDLSYRTDPGIYSALYALTLPNGQTGSTTIFADTAAAYDALPTAMQERLAGLRAIHRHPEPHMNVDVRGQDVEGVSHPVVRTHSVTGERSIFVSPMFVSRIEGLCDNESSEILTDLHEHCAEERFLYTHEWQLGEIVIWDNRSTMHRRLPFDGDRLLWRTQSRGDKPI